MANQINIIAAGGSGINVMNKIGDSLLELGEGFSNINIKYIDTSITTIQKYLTKEERQNNFFMVKETKHSNASIDGSGGERSLNSASISEEIKRYLDENKITKKVTGEIYVVVSSGSSGTGSVVAPLLVKSLIDRDIPTVAIVIGDTSNHMYAINTKNTLASYDNIAKKSQKALSMYYINNHTVEGNSVIDKIAHVDKQVFQFLSILSLFMSGKNSDIDYQDMIGLIAPTMFTSIKIPAGIYDITAFKGDLKLPEYCTAMLGRTLTVPGTDVDINIKLHHKKDGEVLAENVLSVFKDQWPISMVTHHGSLKVELSVISDTIREYDAMLNAHEVDDLFGTDNSEENDDGLIL